MLKKYVSGLAAGFLVLGVPAMALACNWGAKAEGDCNQISLSVAVERGKSEAAGTYDLYWSKEGNPKKGEIIEHGEIPALKKGETHQVVYDLDKNKNGHEGNYAFYLKKPNGSIWSNPVKVTGCSQSEQPAQPEQPNKPEQPAQPEQPNKPEQPAQPEQPNKPEQPAQPEQPTKPEQPAQPGQPAQPEQPAKGGQLPKTATSYPLAIAWSGALLATGLGILVFRKRHA